MQELELIPEVAESIARAHSVSMSAIALNYNMIKDILPVFGLRKLQQAEQKLQAPGWRVTDEDFQKIGFFSLEGKKMKLWRKGYISVILEPHSSRQQNSHDLYL